MSDNKDNKACCDKDQKATESTCCSGDKTANKEVKSEEKSKSGCCCCGK